MKILSTGSLIILWVACFFYSCDSSSPAPTETNPPVIQLDYPDSNGLIINGDTISFVGSVTDDTKLHSMLITIQGMQSQLYYTYNPNVDGLSSFNFNTPWLVNGIPYDTTGYLDMIVTDQSGNYATEHWFMRLRD